MSKNKINTTVQIDIFALLSLACIVHINYIIIFLWLLSNEIDQAHKFQTIIYMIKRGLNKITIIGITRLTPYYTWSPGRMIQLTPPIYNWTYFVSFIRYIFSLLRENSKLGIR